MTHKTAEKMTFIVCGDVQNILVQEKKESISLFSCQIILLSSNFSQEHLQSEAPVPSPAHQEKNMSSDDLEVLIAPYPDHLSTLQIKLPDDSRESKWWLGSPVAGKMQGKLLNCPPKPYSPNLVATWTPFRKHLFARNEWLGGIPCGFSVCFLNLISKIFSVNELVSFSCCHNHTFMFSKGAHEKESRKNR